MTKTRQKPSNYLKVSAEKKVKTAQQCRSILYKTHHCQGPAGHKGPHWSFRADGWFLRWANKAGNGKNWPANCAVVHSPPGHTNYPDPSWQVLENFRYVHLKPRFKKVMRAKAPAR